MTFASDLTWQEVTLWLGLFAFLAIIACVVDR